MEGDKKPTYLEEIDRVYQRLGTRRDGLTPLQAAQALTGRHRYVFASLYPGKRPMSENTINAALRRLG